MVTDRIHLANLHSQSQHMLNVYLESTRQNFLNKQAFLKKENVLLRSKSTALIKETRVVKENVSKKFL